MSAKQEEERLNAAIYADLRRRLVTGRMIPGDGLSTRGLAQELGVSQTPVRDALSRLAAEGAVEIRSKRRVQVPAMTPARFDDLTRCRLLLEPEAAALALPHMDDARLKHLVEVNTTLLRANENGDAMACMEANHAFHFTLYRAQERRTLTQMIEMLWLQFGPFLRTVYAKIDTSRLFDRHKAAIAAIEAKDEAALRHAIASDIENGMSAVTQSGLAGGEALARP